MLIFFVVATLILLLLPLAFLCLAFPGQAKVVLTRALRARRRPAWPLDTDDPHDSLAGDVPDAAAAWAYLGGPPAAGETCDRCAMTAAAAVYLPAGRLLLCGHHGREHQQELRTQGALIIGELSFPSRSSPAARGAAW